MARRSALRVLLPRPERELHPLQQDQLGSLRRLRPGDLPERGSGRIRDPEKKRHGLGEAGEDSGGGPGSRRGFGLRDEDHQTETGREHQVRDRRRNSE